MTQRTKYRCLLYEVTLINIVVDIPQGHRGETGELWAEYQPMLLLGINNYGVGSRGYTVNL